MVRNMDEGLRAGVGMEAGDTMAKKIDGNILGNKPSFASVLHEESTDGLSVMATCLGTLIMLDSCTTATFPDPIGNGVMMHTIMVEYKWEPRDVEPVWNDFRGPFGSKKGTASNHNLLKQQMPKSVYQKKTTRTSVSNPLSALEEDNEKSMDDLADSPKRNVVFSLETKVHYFDKDDMDFDDMGQKVEEVEHMNAYSEND
ncbi:hypothetical protein Tco_0140842 [Tanacetum coccineum]